MSRRKGAPWKHRPHHRAFARLSAAGRQRAIDGFRRNEATTAIAAAIAEEHGEAIAVSSLNRFREWWNATERPVLEAAAKAEELVRALKDNPTPEIESVIRQLLQAQRLTAMAEDQRPDPWDLGRLDIAERKLRLQERALALRERELERRVTAAGKKIEKALEGKNLDPDTLRKIRTEVYGLAPERKSA